MTLIRWSPFADIDEFFEETFRPMVRTPIRMAPAIDVYEDNGNVTVKSSISGVKPEEIDITVGDDYVEIKGERREKEEEKTANFYKKEITYGSLYRMVRLPSQVDKDKADSEFEDGILTITIPKITSEKPQVRKIKPKIK